MNKAPPTPSIRLPVLQPGRAGDPGQTGHPEAKEKCGVFGIWGEGPDVVRQTYLAMYAQQHRGQESAGLALTDGTDLTWHAGMGLVPEVLTPETVSRLSRLPASGAIGHTRYSTYGGSKACNAQPLVESLHGTQVAVAHNGNLVNGAALRRLFSDSGHIFHTTSDTEVILHVLAKPEQYTAPDPLAATLRRLQGAFTLVFLFPDRIEACRDPWGWRPLVLGTMPDGRPVVASETVALDVIGATVEREVEPGEIVTLSDGGVESRRFAPPAERLALCAFEHVYFANPSTQLFGQNVQQVREALGETLAREAPAEADYVMPLPDSGRSAANGYARASGISYREGIVPNRYVGRTFIKPTQEERTAAVRLKLNTIREIVEGRRLVVVDDSIVRGTTTRVKMDQIRAAGAKEIHLRISCPPIRHPCYFGIDFAEPGQLIAHGKSVEEIRRFLGVDSLAYLSLEGLLAVMRHDAASYCTACWSGKYPIDVEHALTGQVLDQEQSRLFNETMRQAAMGNGQ